MICMEITAGTSLKIVAFRVKKLSLINIKVFKVSGVQDLLIYSSGAPRNNSK